MKILSLFRNEVKVYSNSPVSYASAGLFIVITAVYFYIKNIGGRSSDLTGLFEAQSLFLMFIVPILTSRTVAEDKKSGMEVLLVTSPTKWSDIITARFLAVWFIVFTMISATALFLPFLLLFMKLPVLLIIGCYAGLFLISGALCSFGVFVSSLTENQITAAIISFIGFLLMMITEPISIAFGGITARILSWFSVFYRFDEITSGILTVNTVVYFISFSFMFVFFTVWNADIRRERAK